MKTFLLLAAVLAGPEAQKQGVPLYYVMPSRETRDDVVYYDPSQPPLQLNPNTLYIDKTSPIYKPNYETHGFGSNGNTTSIYIGADVYCLKPLFHPPGSFGVMWGNKLVFSNHELLFSCDEKCQDETCACKSAKCVRDAILRSTKRDE